MLFKTSTFVGLWMTALSVSHAVTVDPSSASDVAQAVKKAAETVMKYYTPNSQGAIPENTASDASGMQWYESGILWGVMMDYVQITNDQTYVNTVSAALSNASFGDAASFLGGSSSSILAKLTGKWNDDILWWAFGCVSGAEMYGNDARMPNGVKYLDVALNTLKEVYEQWSTETCQGGIYWSRDRTSSADNRRLYKSTITNAQYILLSARVYIITKDKIHLDRAEAVYNWMKSSGLITQEGGVLDGAYAPTCSQINRVELSYISGTTLGGIGWLYAATKKDVYVQDAQRILKRSIEIFSKDSILTDPCETAERKCQANQVQPKGTAVRGYMYLWNTMEDATVRSSIERVVSASLSGMAPTCNDQWGCNSLWSPGSPVYTDVHTQIVAVELLNAAATIRKVQLNIPAPKQGTQKNGATSSFIKLSWVLLAGLLTFFF
jgi:mannan endo-1,6-alpha-mannosidase